MKNYLACKELNSVSASDILLVTIDHSYYSEKKHSQQSSNNFLDEIIPTPPRNTHPLPSYNR